MARQKEKNKAKVVFIDSDAFIAIVKKDDTNHNKAKNLFYSLKDKNIIFCSSNYVYSEVITVLSQRIGHS
ncbi:MAG: hypothetical protein KC733_02425, partial [Candidatus Omnitrophica bacterium]|nr:hypothetical protein [Candidatus Omnitrophota bacterium]